MFFCNFIKIWKIYPSENRSESYDSSSGEKKREKCPLKNTNFFDKNDV